MKKSINFIFGQVILGLFCISFYCISLYLTIDFLPTYSLPSSVNNQNHAFSLLFYCFFHCYSILFSPLFFEVSACSFTISGNEKQNWFGALNYLAIPASCPKGIPSDNLLASCPQAASMSFPRLRRVFTIIPRPRSTFTKEFIRSGLVC